MTSTKQEQFTTDVVIGLEIHVELNTKTKLFCSCPRDGTDVPNTRVCPICLGHPGTRPIMNRKVLESAIKLGLATNCKIRPELIFSRKSYFYPDMSKNFQITQYEEPLCELGYLKLKSGKKIGLTRIHIEEDPAALSYPKGINDSSFSFIDYNRAGNPLVEVVTAPEIHSPKEAREFLNALASILSYLEIYDPNTCTLKADANISVKESDYQRVEIKNISGFKEIEKALNFEITRQKAYLRRGLQIKLETRGWNDVSKTTYCMRTKETEDDYGYIIEPDLPIADIEESTIKKIKDTIPELAKEKAERFIKDYGVDEVDAETIASDPEIAKLYETVIKEVDPIFTAKWFRGELLRVLNYCKMSIVDIKFSKTELIELFNLVHKGKIAENTGKKIMEELSEKCFSPKKYVEEKNLLLMSDDSEILSICRKVMTANEKAVQDYKQGEDKSFNFLVGQVMRETRGRAAPEIVKRCMLEELHK